MTTRTCHGTSINSRLVLNPPDSPPAVYHPGDVILNASDGQQVCLDHYRETCRNCGSVQIFLDDAQGDRVCHQCGQIAEGHVLMMNPHQRQQNQPQPKSTLEDTTSPTETDFTGSSRSEQQLIPLSCDAKPINQHVNQANNKSKLACSGTKRSRVRKIPSLRKRRRMMMTEKTATGQQEQSVTTATNSTSGYTFLQNFVTAAATAGVRQEDESKKEDSTPRDSWTAPPALERIIQPQESLPKQVDPDNRVLSTPLQDKGPRVSETHPPEPKLDQNDDRVSRSSFLPHLLQCRLPSLRIRKQFFRHHFWQIMVALLLIILWLEGCRPVLALSPDILTDTQHVVALTDWNLSSHDHVYSNLSASGVVPGDVLTVLLKNGIIQDPYHDRNFLTQRHIWMGGDPDPVDGNYTKRQWTTTWIYSTTFETPAPNNVTEVLYWKVILEGVKMGADVAVNGIHIGEVTDQFLRYDMGINHTVLQQGSLQNMTLHHNLTVTFDPSKKVNGRFTACSGGWDWAPYAREQDAQGTQMFTLGIVKPVSIIGVRQFYISYVVPKIYYLGDHPTTPMHQPEDDFSLHVAVHINFVAPISFSNLPDLVLQTPFGNRTASIPKISRRRRSAVVTLSLQVSKEMIDLWWPNGMGSQQLYNISVGIANSSSTEWVHKRIGFRVSALVTTNDTAMKETSADMVEEGSGQHGMYFRVNGAVVLARGANFIPTDQLEGRMSDEAHRITVQSAATANMNMIRIWGGGMVLPDAFYDTCDEKGILLYHDMMFVDEEGHRPVKTRTVRNEIQHLVRSLASHPSIVVWSGCNECDVVMGTSSEIYATFAMKTVAEEDDSRSIWPSSPSKHGWRSGVRRIDSRPVTDQSPILTTWDPKSFPTVIETHGPYLRSFSRSYRGMNGNDAHFPYMNTPPTLKKVDVGVTFPNEFSSEFGSSVMSSFESMTGTLSPQYWSLHGGSGPDNCTDDHGNCNNCIGINVMAERNYPCDTHILAYFGMQEDALNEVGKYAFQKQLYMCLIAQTLWMKGEIETRRAKNMYGMLIWQLNENFPTGGWGCIEYSKETKDGSQILGGRWKPLMHLLESSLFRDQIVACGKGGNCYLRNDGMSTMGMTVTFEAWTVRHTSVLDNVNTYLYNSTLDAGQIQWFQLPSDFLAGDNQVLLMNLVTGTSSASNQVSSESVYLPTMPKNITGLHSSVSIKILSIQGTDKGDALVSLESDRLALFVVLTTRAKGRFTENCFVLRPLQKKIVEFSPFVTGESVDLNLLKSSIRVEHLGLYLNADTETNKVAITS